MPEIFFITNRNPIPSNDAATDFGPFFNERGPGYLRLGRAVLDDPKPNKPVPEDLKVQQLEVYPDDPFADPPVLGSVPFLEALEQRVFDPQQRRDVLVYLHGFDTEFKEALQFTAQLTLNVERTRQRVLKGKYGEHVDDALASSRPLQPVVITWPSDGELVPQLSYWSDRRDAEDSRPAIARILLKLRDYLDGQFQARVRQLEGSDTVRGVRNAMRGGDLRCDVRIHLLTQSMGAFVLRHGLQEFRQDPSVVGRPLPQLFDQIILGAADDDDEVFQNDGKLRPLPDLGRQTTVYFNPDDRALLISVLTQTLVCIRCSGCGQRCPRIWRWGSSSRSSRSRGPTPSVAPSRRSAQVGADRHSRRHAVDQAAWAAFSAGAASR